MSKLLNNELLELFFLEVDSYLPDILHCLEKLSNDKSSFADIQELLRFFHNIKGAASQVQLAELSNGAKIVESALDVLLEKEQPISDSFLSALRSVTDFLIKFSKEDNHSNSSAARFHQQVISVISRFQESGESENLEEGESVEKEQEYLNDIHSIFPLLQELAACMREDANDPDFNRLIYGKLSHAVSLLSATFFAAERKLHGELMGDFHLLLERLRTGPLSRQPEIPGLMQDFLGFLVLSFTRLEGDNGQAIQKVNEQFRIFKSILLAISRKEEEATFFKETEKPGTSDLFDDSVDGDEAIDFMSELDESDFMEVGLEADEEEGSEEPVDEDQQILMEIFKEECDEHFIVINQSLNVLESAVKEPAALTAQLRATVGEMRRAVHTLKGAASMTGVNLLAKGAHSLEDMLDWLNDEAEEIDPSEVRVIATGVDVIELLSQSPQANESERLNKLVVTINEYLASKSANETSKVTVTESIVEESPAEELIVEKTGSDGLFIEEPVEEIIADEPTIVNAAPTALPGDSSSLRVRLEDLDELVSIEGELVVARGAMEKMLEEFSLSLIELENVKENLRRKSQELESGFEVQSLYGFNPAGNKGGVDGLSDSELADFDPIELDRYSQLNLIIRSLNEISVDVNAIHTTLASLAGDISGQIGKQQLTMRLMQDKLMRIRMTPLSSISRILFRTVRDTATKLNKNVALTITGEDVYMDRFVWARITDPLMHILRNGVDHGIESAEIRAANGKPEAATIRLYAEQRSRYVVLRISDDGGGVDLQLIKDKLIREGLSNAPEKLSEKELLQFLFHPSFSTRQNITTISGRGVGLDVVKKNIQDLRGSVKIHNSPGQGVEFEIQIPFSLSVNRAAMISVAGQEFAIPLQDISQVKHFSRVEIDEKEGLWLKFGDARIPVSNLGYHLQLEKKMDTLPEESKGLHVVMFMKGDEQYGVAVDSVTEQREIIVKNLGSHLIHVQGISGVTLTGSGGLIPILNLGELVSTRVVDEVSDSVSILQVESNEPLKVLIVDDSISVRHSVARLVESQSWKQQQAVDGLDALAKLENFLPDVIILDIEMPRMNGYELKSSLNNQPLYKDIPVVMLTSRASEKHQQKARELGVEYYLTKPYQDEIFVKLLESIRNS